jgi:hypothetical protein
MTMTPAELNGQDRPATGDDVRPDPAARAQRRTFSTSLSRGSSHARRVSAD